MCACRPLTPLTCSPVPSDSSPVVSASASSGGAGGAGGAIGAARPPGRRPRSARAPGPRLKLERREAAEQRKTWISRSGTKSSLKRSAPDQRQVGPFIEGRAHHEGGRKEHRHDRHDAAHLLLAGVFGVAAWPPGAWLPAAPRGGQPVGAAPPARPCRRSTRWISRRPPLNDIVAEFESHWIGQEVEGSQYLPAEAAFFR